MAPSLAAAAQRFASQTGSGTACTEPSPCTLSTAVTGASSGDEVILLPGASLYFVAAGTTITVPAGVEVHGQDGQPRPTIIGDWVFSPLTVQGAGVVLRHLNFQNTGPAVQLAAGSVVRDVYAVSTNGGQYACNFFGDGTLTDSICRASNPTNTTGVGTSLANPYTVTLRNVTAIGASYGVGFDVGGSSSATVDAKNVIASGAIDVRASASSGSSITVTMDHSNYDTEQEGFDGGTVTDPGTGSNQTIAPVFIDANAGDFHQASTSPTIDAGTLDPHNGPTDIDSAARDQGLVPDIGADEFTNIPPTADVDGLLTTEDTSVIGFDPLTNDTDPDGAGPVIRSVTQPPNGQVLITGGGTTLDYQPDADYCNGGGTTDDFTYTLNGGSTAMVLATVTCVDDAPVAVGDSATVAQDAAPRAIDVLANDTDVDAGPRAVASKSDPAHGTVTITGGGSGTSYQPSAGYCGPDSFGYTLNGGSSATVSITVTCAPRDTLAPGTSLLKKPPKVTRKRKAKFRFASTEAGSTFLCKLDRRPFRPCRSPAIFTVRPGKHRLRVKAVDAAGNVDATPASYRWKVLPR